MDKEYFSRLGYDSYLAGVLADTVALYSLRDDQIAELIVGKQPPDVALFVVHVFNVCHNRMITIHAIRGGRKKIKMLYRPVLPFAKFRRQMKTCMKPYTIYRLRYSKVADFIPKPIRI